MVCVCVCGGGEVCVWGGVRCVCVVCVCVCGGGGGREKVKHTVHPFSSHPCLSDNHLI